MIGDRVILPSGFEAIFCGVYAEDPSYSALVHDFVRYGTLMDPWETKTTSAGERDIHAHLQANRDIHYPRIKHTINELDFTDKTVVLIAPGPSLAESVQVDLSEHDIDHVVTIAMNKAVGMVPANLAFISERSAREEWVRSDSTGYLAEWIPENMELVTCPDASGWLCDVWPDKHRYYAWMPFVSVPEDPRGKRLQMAGAHLWSFWHTPVMALHLAKKCNAKQIVLVGHDYSLDIEGNVYPGHAAKDHPNQWQKGAVPVIGHDGKKVLMNQTLAYYRNIMAACCYWVERNGTPVLNATPHGLLNWRPTNLVDALTKEYQPIVDFITGNINESLAGDTSIPEAPVHGEVERPQLQPA